MICLNLFTMGGSEFFKFAMEGTGMFFQGLKVTLGCIGVALLPASKVNAHQLVGQGAAGLMMQFSQSTIPSA